MKIVGGGETELSVIAARHDVDGAARSDQAWRRGHLHPADRGEQVICYRVRLHEGIADGQFATHLRIFNNLTANWCPVPGAVYDAPPSGSRARGGPRGCR